MQYSPLTGVSCIWTSVTGLGEIYPLWQNLKYRFTCWQYFEPIWQRFFAVGQIYLVLNGQMLKNNLAI